jgi:hypothetical protein
MTLLWILSGVAFAIAAGLMGLLHLRVSALWVTWAGVALAITAVFVWLHATMSQRNTDSNTSLPANTAPSLAPLLEKAPTFNVKTPKYFFLLGNTVISLFDADQLKEGKKVPISLAFLHVNPVTVFVERDHFFADALLYSDTSGKQIVMKHNELSEKPLNWDSNSSQNAFEVVDEKCQPVFQLIYKSENEIRITGVFFMNDNVILVTPENVWDSIGADALPIMRQALKRIFKYPSWKYLGEYE